MSDGTHPRRQTGEKGQNMKHPIHILTSGMRVRPGQFRELEANCTSRTPGPGEGRITFLFEAGYVMDTDDRTIIVDTRDGTFRCLPRPVCVCQGLRHPLDCECIQETCPICGESLVAMELSCSDQSCVHDKCPLCDHYREDCGRNRVRLGILLERDKVLRALPGEPHALAYTAAVAAVLAPGVGDAPILPATERILDELLERTVPWLREWTCRDGSVVRESNFRGWLE